MELKPGNPDFSRPNNKTNRLNYGICSVPFVTTYQYFKNYENIYFLLLSVFQLSTLSILPTDWSPTGPFSTAIPLACCVLFEIVIQVARWLSIWSNDRAENNRIIYRIKRLGRKQQVKNQNLYPGYIISLKKGDICPIDGILLGADSDGYGRISMALFTGETDIKYVPSLFKGCSYLYGWKVCLENSSDDNIIGFATNKKDKFSISKNHFVISGSTVKSSEIQVLVTACGPEKVHKTIKKQSKKKSSIDEFVGRYIIKVSVVQLVALVLLVSSVRAFNTNDCSFALFFLLCIQDWILLNGIIPFSVKILLILARSLETYNCTHKEISINDTLQVDDFGKINRLICDKTGTITKNELKITKFIDASSNYVLDIESNKFDKSLLSDKVYQCMALCVHRVFSKFLSVEDKIIHQKYLSLGERITDEYNATVEIRYKNKKDVFTYVRANGLNFTFDRKMSSVVVRSNGEYYLFSKGSIDAIYGVIREPDCAKFKSIENIISNRYPDLRLMAFAWKKLTKEEVLFLAEDRKDHSALESNLHLIGIIGIRDTIQNGVTETINLLNNANISCSICTGDRKLTAIAVAESIGIAKQTDLVEYNPNLPNPKGKTIVFNGSQINDKLAKYIALSKNFIAYNMKPADKQKVAEFLESSENINSLAVGDGFNDFGMFDRSSISVAIRGNAFVESYADFAIGTFADLITLFGFSQSNYRKNSILINFTFFRCSVVVSSIVAYCLLNYDKEFNSPYNGFVIQAFNFAWCIFGLLHMIMKNDEQIQFPTVSSKILSWSETNRWNITGMMYGIMAVSLIYSYKVKYHFSDILALVVIFLINFNLISKTKMTIGSVLFASIGLFNFFLYILYTGSSGGVIDMLLEIPSGFYFTLLISLCF